MRDSFYTIFISIAIFTLFVVIGFYYFYFKQFTISTDQAVWGAFGDYVGGTLNPIFALLSFIALLSTIRLQSEELRLTREELEKSSQALMEQSDSFKIQNDSIKRQNFENTFFKMLDLHNKIVENIITNETHERYKIQDIRIDMIAREMKYGKTAIAELLKVFLGYVEKIREIEDGVSDKSINKIYDNFHNEFQEIIGHYFGNIYQILKFIDDSNIEDKKRYSSLYRAQFSKSEIDLLAYHCISQVAIEKFKPLIEKYQFLEHLKNVSVMHDIKHLYDENAFGKNKII